MAKDPYSALWISHSRINDFRCCPRAYYLKYQYRNPKTGHKIKLMSPPLALGQIVHDVLDSLSVTPLRDRFKNSFIIKLHEVWEKIEGKKGGFGSSNIEQQYKTRAETMLLRLMKDPGPLARLAVKIKMDLPHYWISEKENIILSGRIDWLEYLPKTDSVHIIDFKTSRGEEDDDSLQLPIYQLLAEHCQNRPVAKTSYWYLEREDGLVEKKKTDTKKTEESILKVAHAIGLATKLKRFTCPKKDGCRYCMPYELILKGEAEFVGVNAYREDIYVIEASGQSPSKDSEIL